MHDEDRAAVEALRPRPKATEWAVPAALAGAAFLVARSALVVDFGESTNGPQPSLIVALLIAGVTGVALRLTWRKARRVALAAFCPLVVVSVSFVASRAPYIKQSLGLSHEVGAILLAIVPGLAAAAAALLTTATHDGDP